VCLCVCDPLLASLQILKVLLRQSSEPNMQKFLLSLVDQRASIHTSTSTCLPVLEFHAHIAIRGAQPRPSLSSIHAYRGTALTVSEV